jgi:hypothetical protein
MKALLNFFSNSHQSSSSSSSPPHMLTRSSFSCSIWVPIQFTTFGPFMNDRASRTLEYAFLTLNLFQLILK